MEKSAVFHVQLHAYLNVEGKLVEFHGFEKGSFDSASLADECFVVSVEEERVVYCLLRLPHCVVGIQLRMPVVIPSDGLRVLRQKFHTEDEEIEEVHCIVYTNARGKNIR